MIRLKIGDSTVVGVEFNESENTLTITQFRRSGIIQGEFGEAAGYVWKDVYGVNEHGKIYLSEKIIGRHKPAHHVEDKFEFD